MSVHVPGEVMQFMATVVGANWPEGDEDSMWRLAEDWDEARSAVESAVDIARDAASDIAPLMVGEAGDNFLRAWSAITSDGATVDRLLELCSEIASDCRNAGADIEYTKLTIIAALLILLTEVIALACSLFGAPAIPAAEAATAATVRMIFMDFVKQMGYYGAVMVGSDVAIQAEQIRSGHRDGWDSGRTLDAVAETTKAAMGSTIGGLGHEAGDVAVRQFVAQQASKGGLEAMAGSIVDDIRHGEMPGSDNSMQTVVGTVSGAYDGHREAGMPGNLQHADEVQYGITSGITGAVVENQTAKILDGEIGVGEDDLHAGLEGGYAAAGDAGKEQLGPGR